jgi:hypothetical protein
LAVVETCLTKTVVLAIEAISIAISCTVHHARAVLRYLALRAAHIIASATGKEQGA